MKRKKQRLEPYAVANSFHLIIIHGPKEFLFFLYWPWKIETNIRFLLANGIDIIVHTGSSAKEFSATKTRPKHPLISWKNASIKSWVRISGLVLAFAFLILNLVKEDRSKNRLISFKQKWILSDDQSFRSLNLYFVWINLISLKEDRTRNH